MYDAVIVGAGPGGATAAAFMARRGLRVLLLDREAFPRDKVCGDGVAGRSIEVMQRLGMIEPMLAAPHAGAWGVTFSGPYGDEVAVPFRQADPPAPPGFVCDRLTFDALVLDQAVKAGAEVWTEATVTGLLREGARIVGVRVRRGGSEVEVHAPLTVGADGAYSVVVRELGAAGVAGMDQLDERHYCAGLRWYWRGVTGIDEARPRYELHFVDEAIPGYFWIFPLGGGRANVGIGMLSAEIKKRDIQLKPLLEQMVAHPRFRERFVGAAPEGKIRGWGLPFGSKPRPMAGDGWLLVGDAASLIDPFTGEGIGHAMVSGEFAAEWAERAKAAQDFSAAFLGGYRRAVMAELGSGLRLSHAVQRLCRWKWLLNTVFRKAGRSEEVAHTLSVMFEDEAVRKKLVSPMFYLRLLAA